MDLTLFSIFKNTMSKKCDLLGVGVMVGNNVSHSNRKTRRRFLPNLKTVSLKSDTLGVDVTLRVTAATLRTVNKHGNIDSFLINTRFAKLTDLAKSLRTQIKKKLVKTGKFSEVKVVREKKEIKAKVA
jgi:large subunit ribosomal protein L28